MMGRYLPKRSFLIVASPSRPTVNTASSPKRIRSMLDDKDQRGIQSRNKIPGATEKETGATPFGGRAGSVAERTRALVAVRYLLWMFADANRPRSSLREPWHRW